MIFQVLDDKKDCRGIYTNGNFIYDRIPKSANRTWAYSDHISDRFIEYGYLWSEGKSIQEICPEHLKLRLTTHENRMKGHFKSFHTAKINFEDICFYELVPDKQLRHYFEIKNEVCEWVFENYPKPRNYSFLHDSYITIQQIAKNPVNLNLHKLYSFAKEDLKAKSLLRWTKENPRHTVNYDLFGSITGRITTKTGSFPIMNLKKEIRSILKPNLDCFLELDFNAAEIRTMISLMGQQQPQEDIHEWNIKNIFKEDISRAQAKQKFFAWLYNSENKTINSELYSKDILVEKFYKEGQIRTPFGRRTVCDRFHALNYLLQSASSDNCMDRVNKIERFLRDRRSYVAFTIHDCVIIDLHRDDRSLIPQLKEIFEDTKLGQFPSSCHLGKDFGSMREFKWN
jgi:hypothetical protein